jgi:uncharacterized surface protein with fasciclin (FAS1) repeats
MKFGAAAALASTASAFVIPEGSVQAALRTGDDAAAAPAPAVEQNHHDAAWLTFLPGKDTLVSAYDETVDYVTSTVDKAANSLHDWVDEAIASGVHADDGDGGHHHHHHHDDYDYAGHTIYEAITSNEHTKHFAKLVNERPHLVELLNSTKTNSTLFVPIDDAFERIPDDDKHKPSKEFIDDLLLYHVGLGNFPVGHVLDTHTFPTHLEEKLLGGEPQRLRVRVGFTGVRVNFYSKVVKAVETKNGYVAAINSILLPPPMVGRVLTLFPDRFSTLLLAYEKTDFVDFVHNVPLVGTTVFAPSNHAFSRLGPRANAFLFNTKTGLGYLKAILKYHIVPNATLYSDAIYDKRDEKKSEGSATLDFGDDASAETAVQPSKHFDLGTLLDNAHLGVDVGKSWGFLTVRVNGFVNVAVQDGLAKNGVIHVVDKVLIPPHKHHGGEGSQSDQNDNEDISVDELKARLADWVDEDEGHEAEGDKKQPSEL